MISKLFIPLPQSSLTFKVSISVTIDAKSKASRSHTCHDPVNHFLWKFKQFKDPFKKFPIQSVIGFGCLFSVPPFELHSSNYNLLIILESITCYRWFLYQVLKNFSQDNQLTQSTFDSSSYDFADDFVDHIIGGYGFEVWNFIRSVCFRHQGN